MTIRRQGRPLRAPGLTRMTDVFGPERSVTW